MANRHHAPKYLPSEQAAEWNKQYDAALKTAKAAHPDDPRAQHAEALKEANKMLVVAEPKSATDIDNLPAWQVLKREDKLIGDVPHRAVVTVDGRKYAHPIESDEKPKPPAKGKGTKTQSNAENTAEVTA